MIAVPFSLVRRPSSGLVLSVLVATAAGAACSGAPAAQDPNAPIAIRTSQTYITVENRAGLPLSDIDVVILPVGGATQYKKFISRIDTLQKQNLALDEFSSRDGTRFNLRVARPKTVRITAKDINNKAYQVEVPWQ